MHAWQSINDEHFEDAASVAAKICTTRRNVNEFMLKNMAVDITIQSL